MNGSTIIPSARYQDAPAAIEWLCRVFGFEKHAVYEGPNNTIAHAQLTLGQGMFMLGSASTSEDGYNKYSVSLQETAGRETLGLCLKVDDIEAVYERAQAASAEIVDGLKSPEYGGKSFACRDLEGHIWWVGTYDPWETR